jgi:excinuclease ABC subunit C
MLSDLLKEKLALLKPLPGCYLMKNKDDQIIYVGKAKFLDKRVKSYFNRPHNGKTAKMVREIFTFETIITSTEKEALLLEINLIHTYNPPYNILLKDDKAYPYIQLKLDTHPYLGIARRIKDKNSKYYGPYPEGKAARSTLNLLNRDFSFT